MIITKHDAKYKYISTFNTETGFYARTGIIENGVDTGVDPFMSSFPELIDVGVMETCVCAKNCNVDCYQKAIERKGKNMSVENFEKIMKESSGKMFQCLHEDEVVLRKSGNYISSVYIKNIRVGDNIYCGDGFHDVYEKREKYDDVYEINIGYGKTIKATKEHKFLTVDGLKTVEELKVGDEFVTAKNKKNIQSINEVDVVKLIISRGLDDYFFLSDCEGLMEVCNKYNIKRNRNKTVLISKIKNHLEEINYRDAKISKARSPYRLKTIYPITKDFMILLGHYIGNGSRRRYVVNEKQTKMIDSIKKCLQNCFDDFSYTTKYSQGACLIELSSNVLHEELFDNIFGCRTPNREKQLPIFIYSVSDEMILYFLEGYFCDGNIDIKTHDGNYGEIIFNTSSEKLFKDLTMLLSKINVNYSVRTEDGGQFEFSKNDKRIINRKKRYRIIISNLLEIRKIYKVISEHIDYDNFLNTIINVEHNENYLRHRKGYIINSIKNVGKRRVIDININSKEHLFVTTHFIVSHNCAMGGAGDVDTHENFEDLLKICKKYNIVPNFTTSGIMMTKEKAELCKKYCGAVAVSEHHAQYTKRAVNLLLNAGVKTNIHYVLSNNSIDEAITRIENNDFPKGINAVIFLLYKPVGLGTRAKVLHTDDPRVKRFFEAIENVDHNFKIGFDSCTVPALINYTTKVNPDSFDTCEGGRWSMYITSDMKALPCSFDNQGMKWSYDISNDTIENAWNSDIFENFRNYFRYSCPNCKRRRECMGGCPITREIVLCDKTEKDEVIWTMEEDYEN